MKCFIKTLDGKDLKSLTKEKAEKDLIQTYTYPTEDCEYCGTVKICNEIRENNRKILKNFLLKGYY